MAARITLIAETGSTNADMAALAGQGWEEAHWLRAERQTAGRGRMGRDWQGSEGNLHASTLIRLRPGDPPVSGLGLLVGVALHEAVSHLLPQAEVTLKWPNDLFARGGKLAGILLERIGDAIIVGVGANVQAAPRLPDRATIALKDLPGGEGVSAQDLIEALAASFDHWLTQWRQDGFAPVRAAWLAAAHPIGTMLTVTMGPQSRLTGRFEGVAEDGALLVGLDDGTLRTVHSGDVGIL